MYGVILDPYSVQDAELEAQRNRNEETSAKKREKSIVFALEYMTHVLYLFLKVLTVFG